MVTHWVTISNFNELLPYPNELDLSRHENALAMRRSHFLENMANSNHARLNDLGIDTAQAKLSSHG